MGLEIGNITASSGMSKAIFDQLNTILSPPLNGTSPEDMETIRNSWRNLAFAIAAGVIEHIKLNMVIKEITTQGNISATVSGNTATQENVVFIQNNDGTGLIE